MDDIKAKQQIVDKIKSATNILVTVSNSPSVDALSAALGLTLLFDKLEKHPTAVFSGDVPPAISFLNPEEVFDENTDSLRDFIIALDKEKADHLRYKVEGDSVKIFITPYKTTITGEDLVFSQGDFNVELVIALGVDVQEHLDSALESSGRILHDADIITLSAGKHVSNLGGIDWHDDQASSLSEMVAGLAEALKTDKNKSLVDATIATAFLTGIVAETDRFSNTHTTSRVMTVAAQLMGAGADQQLIASKLQQSHEIGSTDVENDETSSEESVEVVSQPKDLLSISHKSTETLEEMDKRVKAAESAEAVTAADKALDIEQGEHTGNTHAAGAYAIEDNKNHETSEPIIEHPVVSEQEAEPSFGGALSATTEQAADDARRAQDDEQNKTILNHSYLAASSDGVASDATAETGTGSYALGHDEVVSIEEPAEDAAPVGNALGHELVIEPPTEPIVSNPVVPPTPVDLGLPMPPPLPDFSAQQPAAGSAYAPEPTSLAPQPGLLGDILAPEPVQFPQAPVQPFVPPAVAPPSNDPGQFQIPGQQ